MLEADYILLQVDCTLPQVACNLLQPDYTPPGADYTPAQPEYILPQADYIPPQADCIQPQADGSWPDKRLKPPLSCVDQAQLMAHLPLACPEQLSRPVCSLFASEEVWLAECHAVSVHGLHLGHSTAHACCCTSSSDFALQHQCSLSYCMSCQNSWHACQYRQSSCE